MFGVNTYVVSDPESHEAMVVDPGMISDTEERRITDYIRSAGLTVKYVVHTHLHLDHAFGHSRARALWGVTPMAHEADLPLGRQLPQQAMMFGVPGRFEPVNDITPVNGSTVLSLGSEQIKVIESPGHSPGGIALYAPASGWIISGDSLFNGGIGRTDLPGGDYKTLIDTLRSRYLTLPGSTVVYPGHGPTTTIAQESSTNPYI